jgi:hypothetical protein
MKELLIGTVVLYLGTVLVSYFEYLAYRNIFTQKIMFLNKKLTAANVDSYDLSKEAEYFDTLKRSAESSYPPKIIEQNKINSSYSMVIVEFGNKRKKLIKRVFVSSTVLVPLFIILLITSFFLDK